ncbi:MAG TPA: DUF3617 family protein [Allosphingosinicella sp.]|nr:DUF3617 family protein [Allosphingosinicella sp.]
MKLPAALLVALAAAACNSQGGNGQAPGGTAMRPGLWELTTRVVTVDAPTAPAEIQPQLQAALAAATTVERSCLTPGEAANPGVAIRDRVIQGQSGYTCETGEEIFAGGRIRMTLNCRSNSGAPDLRQAMVGSFTADTLQAAISGEGATPATAMSPSIPVRVESALTGRRVGDCTE